MEVSGSKYDEAQEINRLIMTEVDGESEEIPRLRKKRKFIRKVLSKAHVPALASQESLPSFSASRADVFAK